LKTRFGTTEEIADSVVFLLSKKSSFITGIALPIDGGISAL
jgi:NAD(P)-dependent dehydrogenase (short-subunit alcohol dehydrogenase family)